MIAMIGCPLRTGLAALAAVGVLAGSTTAQQNLQHEKVSLLSSRSLRGTCVPVLSDTLRSSLMFMTGGDAIHVRRMERETKTSPWFVASREETVSFVITDLDSVRGGEDVFVAGVDDSGGSIIERWHFVPRTNGWTVGHNLPAGYPGIGNTAPTVEQSLYIWGQGDPPWIDPESNKIAPPNRAPLVKEEGDGPFIELEADPQGRYLLFYDLGNRELKMTSLEDGTTTTIATDATALALARLESMDLLDIEGIGRTCILRRFPRPTSASIIDVITVGVDSDNDGLFEAWHNLDESGWLGSPFSARDDWTRFHYL